MTSVLDTVVEEVGRVARAGELPIVVFDLDSTLIDTAVRQHRILHEFADASGDDALKQIVSEIGVDALGYRVAAPLEARGITDRSILDALDTFWHERFFTSAYCAVDRPSPGAVAYVRRVFDRGGLVYYLTGRPVEMAEGTLSVLHRAGFPVLGGRTVLHMRPTRTLSDRRFKSGAVAEIRALKGVVCATFENEPAHAAMFLTAFPGPPHVLVGEVRSSRAPDPDPGLICIESFHV